MDTDGRAGFADLLRTLRAGAGLSLADLGAAAHIARGYIHHLEHGRRWPSRTFVKALDSALDARGSLLDAWATAGGRTPGLQPVNPDDRERLALAARHPRRVDDATVSALANVLAANRRLEDSAGSAAVLPAVRHHLTLARKLLTDSRPPVRDRVGALTGELHQYLGWLLAETGHLERAGAELDAALAIGVEIDDPDLTSLALSYKGHLAWMRGDAHEVVALSGAAGRDGRVFVAQHAYNVHQQARGWAMAGDAAEMDRALGQAADLTDTAIARQAEAPDGMYWYGAGFFTLQRGLTWHTVRDSRYAARAAGELTSGLGQLPDGERDSEWAAIFTVAAAESYTDAGDPERAVDEARRAVAVCRATCSTRLAATLRRVHAHLRETWPTVPAVRELGDVVRTLVRAR
ncbi:MAG: helix-turn-helix domain-containing protein [Pseudonocardiaceae bacterium]